MRRLHLIKPWRLHTIRQRLVETREHQHETAVFVPANAPAVTCEAIVDRGNFDGRSANRKQAPVSDVIFASQTMRNCR